MEILNKAFWRLSSGMIRGKGCSWSGGFTSAVTTSAVTTGSEGKRVEGTGSPVGFGLGVGASMAFGELLISTIHGMAVDWLVPDVDAGAAGLRKGSCSIDGNDSAWTASGSTRLRWRPCLAKSARVSWGWQSRASW